MLLRMIPDSLLLKLCLVFLLLFWVSSLDTLSFLWCFFSGELSVQSLVLWPSSTSCDISSRSSTSTEGPPVRGVCFYLSQHFDSLVGSTLQRP